MFNNSGDMNSQQGMGSGGNYGEGGGGMPMDSGLSDLLGRRPSMGMGFDGMDTMGRRESVDTAAILDACIMDLTRRRRMVSGMGMSSPNPGVLSSDTGFSGPASGRTSLVFDRQNSGVMFSSLAKRQRELQQQQYEIEQHKQELELQRQQLLASLQETSISIGGIPTMNYGMPSIPHDNYNSMPIVSHDNYNSMPNDDMGMNSMGPNSSQQWWVCQLCNSRAFASREEAMQHEALCNTGSGSHSDIRSDVQVHDSYVNPDTYSHLPNPLPLAMPTDKDWLTPLHCFVRRHCVEVFSATPDDVATPSKGKRKPIQVDQIGIRCPHCKTPPDAAGYRERGSVYYPTTISSIYNATMNLLQRHLHSCPAVPDAIMDQYQSLKGDDARSGTSKKYWVESALSIGLVDTPNGIRFSTNTPPPLPRLTHQQHSIARDKSDVFSLKSNAAPQKKTDDNVDIADDNAKSSAPPAVNKEETQQVPLVSSEDKPYATPYSYELLCQMQPCVFTEADRLGKRKGLPAGFAGLACRHCFGGYGSGRFFPSSIKTLSDTSKTLNVLHNHMMRCRKCPQEVRDSLEKLRVHHDDERAKMKFGSQKAFFARIWSRLHGGSPRKALAVKRKLPSYPDVQQNPLYMQNPDVQQNPLYMQNPDVQQSPLYMQNPIESYMQHIGMQGGLDVLSRQAASESQMKRHRAI